MTRLRGAAAPASAAQQRRDGSGSARSPSHLREDTATKAFDTAYEGTPTWDIGRPQGAVVRLAEGGMISGAVLDAGCGTGETALYLAGRGHAVVGIDFAAAAIARARAKAAARGLGPAAATFVEWDALRLPELVARLGHAFDTILDVGLFHTLQPADRETYATSLRAAIAPGGRCFLLCWSDRNPFGYGPERVRRDALRQAFRVGWSVESIDGETLETLLPSGRVHAWLARLRAA